MAKSNLFLIPRFKEPTSRWWDYVVVFLTFYSVIGSFAPPETYFAPNIPGTYEVQLIPYPITPVLLVLTCSVMGYMLFEISRMRRLNHDWAGYAFVFWAFASAGWSGDPMMSFQRALRLLPIVMSAILFAQLYSLHRMLRLMVIGFLLSACASILVSALMPSLGLSRMTGGYESAWRGALGHKNAAGFQYALGIILTIFAWRGGAIRAGLACATLLTCLIMVGMAQSGTAMIGLVIAILPTAILMGAAGANSGVRMMVLLLFAIPLLATPLFQMFLPAVLEAMGRDPTLTGRTQIWEAVLPHIAERPLTGFGYAFWSIDTATRDAIWRELGLETPHSHNSWIDVTIQLGGVGLLLVGWLCLSALVRTINGLVVKLNPFAPLALALLLIIFVRTMSEAQFSEPSTVAIFWLVWIRVTYNRSTVSSATTVGIFIPTDATRKLASIA